MFWQIWPWCFKIYRPSKIFTGPGLLAVVFHKPCIWTVGPRVLRHRKPFDIISKNVAVCENEWEDRAIISKFTIKKLWLFTMLKNIHEIIFKVCPETSSVSMLSPTFRQNLEKLWWKNGGGSSSTSCSDWLHLYVARLILLVKGGILAIDCFVSWIKSMNICFCFFLYLSTSIFLNKRWKTKTRRSRWYARNHRRLNLFQRQVVLLQPWLQISRFSNLSLKYVQRRCFPAYHRYLSTRRDWLPCT